MKRTPITRKPMKRDTAKSRARIAAWTAERDAHLAAHPRCEIGWDCWGPLDAHHVQRRGAGGTRGATGPLLTVCRKHHDYIHQHPKWAEAQGYSIRREASK